MAGCDGNRDFLLDCIYKNWQLEVRLYSKEGVLCYYAGKGAQEAEVSGSWLAEALREKCRKRKYPLIYMEEDMVYFMAFLWEEELYLFGPACAEPLSFSQLYQYRRRHEVSIRETFIPWIEPVKILPVLSMVFFLITGKKVGEDELLRANKSIAFMEKQEQGARPRMAETEEGRRFSYKDELEWIHAIETGSIERTDIMLTPENLQKMEYIGKLAQNNSFKQYEYMVITTICLASRAAMTAGVNPYEAYTLSDIYYQKGSRCRDVMELLNIHLDASAEFSALVRKKQEKLKKDNYIEQCKDYIAKHRRDKIDLKKMADELGINRSYLSRKFAKQEGITLQNYVLDSKLEAAANILKYSDAKVGEIMDYLGFASHSYFGERFRKKYGMTPLEYRARNKVIGFEEGHNNL